MRKGLLACFPVSYKPGYPDARQQLAERLGLRFEGPEDPDLSGAAPLETAGPSDLSFTAGPKSFDSARFPEPGASSYLTTTRMQVY